LTPLSPVYGQTVTVSATVSGAAVTPAGTVVFTVDTSTYSATVSNGVATANVVGLNAGTHSLSASYTSSNGYMAATSTTRTFPVGQATLTITPACANRQFGAPNTCSAAVTGYQYSDTVSTVFVNPPTGSTTATRSTPAGTYPVAATNLSLTSVGGTNYVESVGSSTFVILGGSPQSIIFLPLPDFAHGGSYQLTARTTSGLPVSYSVTAGNSIASVSGSTLTVTGTGTVTVQANQSTDPTRDYAAAVPVSRSFTAQ
jgi:hypothetical protein